MTPLVTDLIAEIADRLPTRRQLECGLPGYVATTLGQSGVPHLPTSWGNPRHSHRCVREP